MRARVRRLPRPPLPVLVVLLLGVALRVLALAASGPVSLYENDSRDYLAQAARLRPDGYHPLGYAVVLRLLGAPQHLLPLAVAQHALGLATGAVVAAAALRLGARPWLAALAAAPVLLDPWLVVVEQFVVSESLFTALVAGAVLAGATPRTTGRAVLAGLLLAAAVLTRTVALPLLVLALVGAALAVAAAARRRRTRPLLRLAGASGLAAALPVLAYVGWFATAHGHPGLAEHQGGYLYARLAPFADCAGAPLAGEQVALCDRRTAAERPQPDWYLWHPDAPLKHLPGALDARLAVASGTARVLLLHDPLAWATSTLGYLAQYAKPVPDPRRVDSWVDTFLVDDRTRTDPGAGSVRLADGYRVTAHVRPGPTAVLRALQRHLGTPLLPLALLGLAALPRSARRRSALLRSDQLRLGPVPAAARRTAALALATAAVLLVVPSATTGWDVRFGLPCLPLLGLAGALGLERLLPRRSAPADGSPVSA